MDTPAAALESQGVEQRLGIGGTGGHLHLHALHGILPVGVGHRPVYRSRAAHETVGRLHGEHLVRPVWTCHHGIEVIVTANGRVVVIAVDGLGG